MKKMVRLAAAFVAGVVLCASPASRAETYSDGTHGWEWEWNEDETGAVLCGVEFLSTNAPNGSVTIPSFVLDESDDPDNPDEPDDPNDPEDPPTEIPVVGIAAYFGDSCRGVTEIVLPASVTEIGEEAFEDCVSLETVALGENLEFIGAGAFYGCTALASVTIPASVTEIGEEAFAGCESLEEVIFEGDMDEIDMDLFSVFDGTPWLAAEFLPSPENDDFADAEELEGESGSVEGTLRYATVEPGDCILDFTDPEATVWYKWTAPLSGAVVFTADAADVEDNFLLRLIATRGRGAAAGRADDGNAGSSSYSATASASPPDRYETLWDDDGFWFGIITVHDTAADSSAAGEEEWDVCGGYSDANWVAFPVVEGETYYVSVAGLADEDEESFVNEFTLSWESTSAPENDDFADAEELDGDSGSVDGTTILATVEEDDPLAEEGYGATVWYKWTSEADGEITFSAYDSESMYEPVIGVYTSTSNDLEVVDIAANKCRFDTFAGETYYIAVAGEGDAVGPFTLEWFRYQLDIDEDGVVHGFGYGSPSGTLNIPEGVTAIADWAFADDYYGIETVNLPSTLQSIGAYAFAWCYELETVNGLTDGVEVDPTAFRSTPYNATRPFRLVIDEGVLVGFEGTCPAVVEIPEGVTAIAWGAFDGEDGYESYDPDATHKEWGVCDTNGCSAVEVPGGWVWHSRAAGLTTVKLPATLAWIAKYAFHKLENLATVTCANPDVAIELSAFAYCDKLAGIGLAKKGAEQTGWQVTFPANAYVDAVWNTEAGRWDWQSLDGSNVAYAAGETLTLPVDNLSWMLDDWEDAFVVTNAEDGTAYVIAVGEWGVHEEEYENGETYRWEGWKYVPTFFTAVWETVTPDLFEGEQTDAFEGDAQYTGWLRDADGNLVGTVTVKAGKPNKKTKAVKLTATVVMLANGKKQTFTGTATAGQLANVTLSGKSGSMNVTLSDDSVTGTYGAYTIEAAKNVFTSKDSGDKANAKSVAKRNWTVTLASAKGYTAFTLAVAAKGKTKVTGVLPDGTKVSVSAQAVVGDGGRWAVPVMFAKKSKFGFVAWFDANGFSLVSDLTPLKGPKGAVTEWDAVLDACGPVGSLAAGAHALAVDAASVEALIAGVNAELLPTAEEVKVAGNKWTLAKAAKVAYKGGAWTVTPGAKGGAVANASGAKLTFTPKTGTFKGSFTAYSVKRGKLAKTKFTVNGAVVNGVAYGTAFNKTAGSVPLTVQ